MRTRPTTLAFSLASSFMLIHGETARAFQSVQGAGWAGWFLEPLPKLPLGVYTLHLAIIYALPSLYVSSIDMQNKHLCWVFLGPCALAPWLNCEPTAKRDTPHAPLHLACYPGWGLIHSRCSRDAYWLHSGRLCISLLTTAWNVKTHGTFLVLTILPWIQIQSWWKEDHPAW